VGQPSGRGRLVPLTQVASSAPAHCAGGQLVPPLARKPRLEVALRKKPVPVAHSSAGISAIIRTSGSSMSAMTRCKRAGGLLGSTFRTTSEDSFRNQARPAARDTAVRHCMSESRTRSSGTPARPGTLAIPPARGNRAEQSAKVFPQPAVPTTYGNLPFKMTRSEPL
jgi:hypothetical protein